MRKSGVLILFMIFTFLFVFTCSVTAETVTEVLESKIIESFDNPENPEEAEWSSHRWVVVGSKFAAKEYDEEGNVVDEYPKTAYVESWPEALFGANKEGRDLKVLGIHGKFDRRAYNFIEIIPVADENDEEGNPVFKPIRLPGKTQRFDVWVWGSNYNYYAEAHFRDFKGIVHVLKLGDLDYTGWRNLQVRIPGYIPQSGGYVTSGGYLKELELIKLVIWTRPEERVDDFYIYLDQIKTLTDTFVSRFDGDDLADPEKIEEVWQNNGEGN
jgi:hypothetical protein